MGRESESSESEIVTIFLLEDGATEWVWEDKALLGIEKTGIWSKGKGFGVHKGLGTEIEGDLSVLWPEDVARGAFAFEGVMLNLGGGWLKSSGSSSLSERKRDFADIMVGCDRD